MGTTISTVSQALLNKMNNTTSSTSSANSSTSSTTSATDSAAKLQNNFMTMLVTQMQNQDPLNPMDNSQVTSQMAQLSTVTGIGQLNSTLSGLVSNFQSTQALQATNLINHSVVVPGNAITLSSGSGQFGVDLTAAATNVQATITDATGKVVDTLNIGSLPAGVSALQWKGQTTAGGTAPDGQYTYTISANSGKTSVPATALSVGVVDSVSTGTSGTMLNIPNVGATNINSVLQIL